LPALTVAVILICWTLPEYALRWGGRGIDRDYRLLAAILLAASAAPYLALSHQWYRAKTIPVGHGSDLFYASDDSKLPEDRLVRDAVEDLKLRLRPADKVAVVPEGVMLNYLLRAESPLRTVNLMPPEMLTFGEAGVVHSLETNSPEFVVLM